MSHISLDTSDILQEKRTFTTIFNDLLYSVRKCDNDHLHICLPAHTDIALLKVLALVHLTDCNKSIHFTFLYSLKNYDVQYEQLNDFLFKD